MKQEIMPSMNGEPEQEDVDHPEWNDEEPIAPVQGLKRSPLNLLIKLIGGLVGLGAFVVVLVWIGHPKPLPAPTSPPIDFSPQTANATAEVNVNPAVEATPPALDASPASSAAPHDPLNSGDAVAPAIQAAPANPPSPSPGPDLSQPEGADKAVAPVAAAAPTPELTITPAPETPATVPQSDANADFEARLVQLESKMEKSWAATNTAGVTDKAAADMSALTASVTQLIDRLGALETALTELKNQPPVPHAVALTPKKGTQSITAGRTHAPAPAPTIPPTVMTPPPAFQIDAVLAWGGRPMAHIQGHDYGLGETVAGWRLDAITPRGVTVKSLSSGTPFTLNVVGNP